MKKVLHKCKPSYSKVHFATSGFDGTTHTDDEVAQLATVDIQIETEDDAVTSSSSTDKKNRRGKSGRKNAQPQAVVQTTSAVAGAKPAQESSRACRHSKRWSAC